MAEFKNILHIIELLLITPFITLSWSVCFYGWLELRTTGAIGCAVINWKPFSKLEKCPSIEK